MGTFRYRRLKQLLEQPGPKTPEDHWQYQRDTLNLMAQTIAPIMARALEGHQETTEMARILSEWNFHDDADQAVPAIFQSTYRLFALITLQDELGEDLSGALLDNWYFWQEKLLEMVQENDSPWFDDISTEHKKETRDDLFLRAGREAALQLKAEMGASTDKWAWGTRIRSWRCCREARADACSIHTPKIRSNLLSAVKKYTGGSATKQSRPMLRQRYP